MTASFGAVEATTNFVVMNGNPPETNSPKMSKSSNAEAIRSCLLLVPPRTTMSPFITALPRSPRRKIEGSACTITPVDAGAMATFFAFWISAREIVTISPTPVFAFLLMIPSILIILSPMSAG